MDPVIDLSHHNPEPDFVRLKSAGLVGVILKATEGTGYIDPTFSPRRERAKGSDLAVVGYHFLKHGQAELQMSHFLDAVQPQRGERVVIDYEDTACTLADLVDAVHALVRQPLNLQITVYGGGKLKGDLGNAREQTLSDFTSLWIAQYTAADSPSWPKATWPVWSLWQWTDKATVPGIPGGVDSNRFNGSADACRRFLSPSPDDPAKPLGPEISISISTPPDARVNVLINGKSLAA
jgi:GH25 family lysozyme M1 (1,4-beta-N-acetylmuramidase)